jgi:hypothetical protein
MAVHDARDDLAAIPRAWRAQRCRSNGQRTLRRRFGRIQLSRIVTAARDFPTQKAQRTQRRTEGKAAVPRFTRRRTERDGAHREGRGAVCPRGHTGWRPLPQLSWLQRSCARSARPPITAGALRLIRAVRAIRGSRSVSCGSSRRMPLPPKADATGSTTSSTVVVTNHESGG